MVQSLKWREGLVRAVCSCFSLPFSIILPHLFFFEAEVLQTREEEEYCCEYRARRGARILLHASSFNQASGPSSSGFTAQGKAFTPPIMLTSHSCISCHAKGSQSQYLNFLSPCSLSMDTASGGGGRGRAQGGQQAATEGRQAMDPIPPAFCLSLQRSLV